MSQITVAIDAGHGGSDSGAVYGDRKEKDDVFKLAMAVGKILQDSGVDVYYVRTDDEYETPFKKATDANIAGVDYFVSIHRNSSETPNQYNGVQTLVYNDEGIKAQMARNVNKNLEDVGFRNLGIYQRPNLVVLKRTKMPAILIEVGFINSEKDNQLFDEKFDLIAKAIADGILDTIYSRNNYVMNNTEVRRDYSAEENYEMERNFNQDGWRDGNGDTNNRTNNDVDNRQTDNNRMNNERMNNERIDNDYEMNDESNQQEDNFVEKLYRVQVGAYRNKDSADRMLNSLLIEGFPAFIVFDNGIYKVQVGAFRFLANAIKMEQRLRRFRYNTYITM